MLTQFIEPELKRRRYLILEKNNNEIVVDGSVLKNFSSNDYLNLSIHPDVKKAFIQGVEEYGVGSGSSALVSGFYKSHQEVEEKFAEFLSRDRVLLFNSGYHANLAVMTTFANRHSTIISDKLCHASILDGVQLSRAKHIRYAHVDLTDLENKLQQASMRKLVVTESVFSMEGDVAPIHLMQEIVNKYQAMFVVDDAHGVGVLGKEGGGVCDEFRLSQHEVPCLVVPLGKAFASMGAVVAGTHELIEELLQRARTYRYTTALPPAIASSLLTTINIISTETWRRDRLRHLITFFVEQAKQRSLVLSSEDSTPIKSVLVYENHLALKMKDYLFKQGYFVSCIRPPTVPKGTARIRVSLNCSHAENDILRLLDLIADFYEKNK